MFWQRIKNKKDIPLNCPLVLWSGRLIKFYFVGQVVKKNKLLIVPRLCIEIKNGASVVYDDLAVDFATHYLLLPPV